MTPTKPSEKEEEYFARLEFEKRKKELEENRKRIAEEEKQKARQLHYMRCPKCGMELIEISFQKIKIDRCSACNGIWLDEGELDEILKREKFLNRVTSIFRREPPSAQ
jgi:phage FluMu protein Com